VLDQFVSATDPVEPKVDVPFWKSFYKYHSISGGDVVSGWINTFFPYMTTIHETRKNLFVDFIMEDGDSEYGGKVTDYGLGMSYIPFLWEYYDTKYSMSLYGGFVGYKQNVETSTLSCALSWAIGEGQKADKSEL